MTTLRETCTLRPSFEQHVDDDGGWAFVAAAGPVHLTAFYSPQDRGRPDGYRDIVVSAGRAHLRWRRGPRVVREFGLYLDLWFGPFGVATSQLYGRDQEARSRQEVCAGIRGFWHRYDWHSPTSRASEGIVESEPDPAPQPGGAALPY
jgi:hypothetical protein